MTFANDGTTITRMGSFISVSNGDTYTLTGHMLTGPKGVVSTNVRNGDEAEAIIIGLHGGKRF